MGTEIKLTSSFDKQRKSSTRLLVNVNVNVILIVNVVINVILHVNSKLQRNSATTGK